MKVLIICTEKLPVPPVRGGAIQTYIAGAVPNLSRNYKITVLGINDPDLPDEETVDGIDYVRVPGKLLEIYREGIISYLKDHSFDLIHIFNRPRLVLPVRDVAPQARMILSMHNDMFKREKIEPEEAEAAIKQLDKIITISDYIGKAISELYPEATPKLQTIYSGVDLDRFVPVYSQKGKTISEVVRRAHNLEGKKVILFAGRLSANKGADVLVRSIPILEKDHPNIALVIVGSKWFSSNNVTDYVAYVRALSERMNVPVITTGFVAPDEIQNWFCAADIFVCPSQWQEPLARVHYEAMAAGLPIITTARGGNPEVIEVDKNGYVIENPDDPHEFAFYLSKLLSSSSLRQNMGEYGRKQAEEKYTWDRVVSDIEGVWQEIEDRIKNNVAIGTTDEEIEIEKIDNEVDLLEDIIEVNEEVESENEEIDHDENIDHDVDGEIKKIEDGEAESNDNIEENESKDENESNEAEDVSEGEVTTEPEQEEVVIEPPPKKNVFVSEDNPPAKPWFLIKKSKRKRRR